MNCLFKYAISDGKKVDNLVKELSNPKNKIDESGNLKKDIMVESKLPETYIDIDKEVHPLISTEESKDLKSLAEEIEQAKLNEDIIYQITNQTTPKVLQSAIANNAAAQDKLRKSIQDTLALAMSSNYSIPIKRQLKKIITR